MRKYSFLALGFGLLVFQSGTYWSAHWFSKWAFLVGGFSLVLAYYTAKNTHWVFFPITAWALLSAASVGVWPSNIYSVQADAISLLALEKNALYAYLVVVMAVAYMANFRRIRSNHAYFYLASVCLAACGALVYLPRAAGAAHGIYFGNPSMNGCLVAATLPFVWAIAARTKGYLNLKVAAVIWLLGLYAIYRTDASVPIGILGVASLAWLVSAAQKKRVLLITVPLAAALVAFGRATVKHQPFFHDSGRFYIWKLMWHWFRTHASAFTGMRLGSFQVIAPIAQVLDDPKVGDYFIWLHNDWLQILLEMGVPGLVFTLLAWGYLLKKAYSKPALFASFCAFSAMALMNYPLRMPIHCFCFATVCCLILNPSADRSVI